MATNQKYNSNRLFSGAVASGVTSGQACIVGSGMVGVALTTRDTSGNATVDFGGVYTLSCKAINDDGASAIALGDPIYYVDTDTPKLSKKASGIFFGFAWSALASGTTGNV